jgi:hypothetical protein
MVEAAVGVAAVVTGRPPNRENPLRAGAGMERLSLFGT